MWLYITLVGIESAKNLNYRDLDTQLMGTTFSSIEESFLMCKNCGTLCTVSHAAAAAARQNSLVDTFGTAGRNYPGTLGENVLLTIAGGVVQINQ